MLKKEIDELKSKFEQFANVDSLNSIGEAQTRLNTAQIKYQVIDRLVFNKKNVWKTKINK